MRLPDDPELEAASADCLIPQRLIQHDRCSSCWVLHDRSDQVSIFIYNDYTSPYVVVIINVLLAAMYLDCPNQERPFMAAGLVRDLEGRVQTSVWWRQGWVQRQPWSARCAYNIGLKEVRLSASVACTGWWWYIWTWHGTELSREQCEGDSTPVI